MEDKNTFDSPFASVFASADASTEQKSAPVSDGATYDDMFSMEELKLIEDYAAKIDITDSTATLTYGAGAQKKISDFSDTALEGVRNKDFGETGEMITNLLTELRGINEDDEKKGFFGLFKKTKNKLSAMKIKYAKAEDSVNDIVGVLEQHQITLMKDIAVFDNLYDMNIDYLREVTMFISAGKKKLEHEKSVTLPAMKAHAEETGRPEDAQAARDFADQCSRFERRIHDLELTRTVAIQTAPQIRLLQNNDSMMSEKIQTVIMNTIPLWKSQMVLALGIAHSNEAMEAQRSVTDMTNELLKQNADKLHRATVDITKESERGITDIETLTATNEKLIATLDEVKQIQTEGVAKRAAAQAELSRIEAELKAKLLEVNGMASAEA